METSSYKLKIKNHTSLWLKDRNNWWIISIVVLALLLRLYFFTLTQNQPLWWDEAEYMLKAKNLALGTPETGWTSGLRPILFPLISSLFFFVGSGEMPLRILMILFSIGGIVFTYLTGKEIFNKFVGVIAAFLMSVFYLDLFYSTRLLVDVPQIFFVTLAFFLFSKVHFGNGSKKLIWLILPCIFIGAQFRFTVGLLAVIFLVFLISSEGLPLFRNKNWYISLAGGIALFSPYLIYTWIRFGNPFYVILQGLSTSNNFRAEGVSAFDIFMEYIHYFPNYTPQIFFIIFMLGVVISLFSLIITIDAIRKNNSLSQKYFFLLISIISPLIYFGFFVNHFEDRYIFMAFPMIFILVGHTLDFLNKKLSKYHKYLGIVLIFLVLMYGGFSSLQRTDSLIKSKVSSYDSLRSAGLWVNQNSLTGESIISSGMPQLTYYSERPVYPYPLNETDFLQFKEEKNATFMILTVWERTPEWTYSWPERNPEKIEIAQAYLNPDNSAPSTIIYRFI